LRQNFVVVVVDGPITKNKKLQSTRTPLTNRNECPYDDFVE